MKTKNIKTLLIANRGEIAVRIAKTAKRLGIKVYGFASTLEPQAPFHAFCDHVLFLEGTTLKDTYLNIPKIIQLMKDHAIDAVHPGYGFLSENAEFALELEKHDLIFVGPSFEAIQKMGLKSEAKKLMIDAGVPVVLGYQGDDQSEVTLTQEAHKIGLPLLVKASAGGGGKGMRIVRDFADLAPALKSAQSEAIKSFGDNRLILEKYIENPRHIEFQIFGDALGHLIHLGERECSIQRRHQKIIEEAPSPTLKPDVRAKMAEAALACGRVLKYKNAGTVEFIVNNKDEFFFLEVNTRLQVEHPVTEMITGLDLVEWQLMIAEGKPLPLTQNQIEFKGHALECRVYAEDPNTGFLPSIGRLYVCEEPQGEGVRIDSGVGQNSEISLHFDPMVAKVITYASNRQEAIHLMKRAIQDYAICGVQTNQAFLLALLTHPAFQSAELNTHFVEQYLPSFKDEISETVLDQAKAFWHGDFAKPNLTHQARHTSFVWDHLKNFRILSSRVQS